MDDNIGGLVTKFDEHFGAVKTFHTKTDGKLGELDARLLELEQKSVRGSYGGGEPHVKSLGEQVVGSDEFKHIAAAGAGKVRIKAITTGSTSGGALGPSDRVGVPDMLQRRPLRVRDLLSPGRTSAGSIEYPRQTTRTNAAAIQAAEGDEKPESTLAFEMVSAPVRTIAHWIPASNQVLQDAPMLMSIIDSELRYGLEDVEENQLLNGSGTGANLNGVYTQATAFSAPFTMVGPTMLDVLLLAIAQLEAANYQPDGIVMNGTDWARILSFKTDDGAYLGNGPFNAEQVKRLWTLPVATTSLMTADKFLVGAFKRGAQIFDRQDATVEISTEHSDFFVRNLVAIRAEERLALAVYRTGAFVKGDFSDAITAATAA